MLYCTHCRRRLCTHLYIGRLFLYHTTNNTWSLSMFDEISHFISATPFTKTFSTFSSAALCCKYSFHKSDESGPFPQGCSHICVLYTFTGIRMYFFHMMKAREKGRCMKREEGKKSVLYFLLLIIFFCSSLIFYVQT